MKYAPLILSLSCLAGGIACLALGHDMIAASLIGAFVGQFAPAAHSTLGESNAQ